MNRKDVKKVSQSKYINIKNFMQDEYPWTFILGARGVGKAEPMTNNILTSTGFKKFGDLKIGDKVYTENGTLTKIIGIFPQGKRDVYELTFRDGSKVTTSDEHLWEVYNTRGIVNYKTTKELYEYKCKKELYLKLPQPLEFDEVQHECPPYVVGAMLGDGCCTVKDLRITSEDFWIPNKISNLLGAKGYKKNNGNYNWQFIKERKNKINYSHKLVQSDFLPNELKQYSYKKRIPNEYIFDGFDNRCELIQGLIDTDGQVRKDGTIIYTSTSLELCNDLVFLLKTLGATGKISERKSVRGKRRPVFDVTILANNALRKKFVTLPKKKERLQDVRTSRDKLYLRECRFIGKEEVQCIEVENATHIYLTSEYLVPTHNTISGFVSMINEFLETGKRGIYMRRYDTEIERTAIDMNLIGKLTGTEVAREKVKINGVFTDVITVNEEPAIYMIALSVAGKFKSNAFPNISFIEMDEFIDMNGRELKDETNKFLQFAMTVFRDMSKFKAVFVANATNLFNCYFLDLEILPTATITRNKDLGVKIVMYKTSEELQKEQLSSKLARIVQHIEGDEGSSLTNTFKGNFDTFIRKLGKNDKYLGTYKLNDTLYGAYKHGSEVIISPKADPNFKFKLALSYGDVDEDFALVDWERYQTLRQMFLRQHVFFTDIRTRTIFMKRFKKSSLMLD